ncbi:DUF4625 domain-containing protein [Flammeovirga yaeyamensis]|uniref:DUF4625 domain-containing protein n=1 Tax=Flammeovirga yaeyamensis TaxID=367791 RepID=A0AAX1NAB4_9BACT|nr:DUF4625 domain-containing protein [Flammeovirga yaeyamensis]MBB3699446.1 hypothetical protein [Flammeovirga yaeyamensis]NMF35297.1 DUF4625 domain-containing protein [Flammeovirga yaeyamensis]QWG04157.1 DUF4625 domain-containing protein [Flammeovirga yaeyamensis]
MKKLQLISIALVMSLFACNQEEELSSNLRIAHLEYGKGSTGHGDNQIGYAGVDLHLEAQVEGNYRVSEVILTIESLNGDQSEEYDYSEHHGGILNPNIHEHPIIPAEFDTGEYYLELSVTDEAGEKVVEGGPLQIVPLIVFNNVEISGEILPGEQISIAFQLEGYNILKDLYIVLVDSNNQEVLSNYYDFTAANTHQIDFSDRISIPSDLPEGEYVVKAIASDARQNTVEEIFQF